MESLNDYLQWIVPFALTIFLAAFSWVNRSAFSRGKHSGAEQATANLVANTIKTLEDVKKDMRDLEDTITKQSELIIRLQERLRYLTAQFNELRARIGLPKIRYEDVEQEEGFK